MKHAILVAGTVVGAAAIVGGVTVQWERISPRFKTPEVSVTLHTPTALELYKQRVSQKAADMQKIVDDFVAKYPGQFGIVVSDIATGASALSAAHDKMVSASVYKMYVGYAVYKRIEEGVTNLDAKLFGTISVRQCMDAMIKISDNDCGYMLGTHVGWSRIDTWLADIGLKNTHINNYGRGGYWDPIGDKYTTAADAAFFLELLYKGKLLNAEHTSEYLALLKKNTLNNLLPRGLPAGTPIAHKTGELYNFVHDAGIVYAVQGDYIIVAMSRDWRNNKNADAAFADLSRQIWQYATR